MTCFRGIWASHLAPRFHIHIWVDPWLSLMSILRQIFSCMPRGFLRGEREVKSWGWSFLRRHKTVDSSLELSTIRHTDTSFDEPYNHSELQILFYRELGSVRVRVWVCCRQAPWAIGSMRFLGKSEQISEFVSDPNLDLLVFFSWGTQFLYKEG